MSAFSTSKSTSFSGLGIISLRSLSPRYCSSLFLSSLSPQGNVYNGSPQWLETRLIAKFAVPMKAARHVMMACNSR